MIQEVQFEEQINVFKGLSQFKDTKTTHEGFTKVTLSQLQLFYRLLLDHKINRRNAQHVMVFISKWTFNY